ncbi:poly-gamma-glutamate biosynthesis protein [Bdellovibrio bacteriovorus W]|nr:poly-gamma-glutamate biosynthesis protein [Bdellovibrio bacteriovorus W]
MKYFLLMKIAKALLMLAASSSIAASADVVITMGGDVNFNRNRINVNSAGVLYSSSPTPWRNFTAGIRPLINGDINFANIETVVSSSNEISNEDKQFAFRSHPNAVRHLIDLGFNLFNLANNHTYDYGHEGMRHTMGEMQKIQQEYPHIVYDGIDYRSNLLKPKIITKNGITFAFATATIGDPRFKASQSQPGILFVRDDRDYKDLIKAFSQTKADFKMLSIHFGTEGKVELDGGQKSRFEYALTYGGVDLIIGHHPHVVRPIQKQGDKYIYYSLGNYMMVGSADITKKIDTRKDWGMFSRLYVERDPQTGKVKVDAIEVIPLTNTHSQARPMEASKATERIYGLNQLGQSEIGNASLILKADQVTGRGIYCDSKLNSIRAKTMCASQLNLRF